MPVACNDDGLLSNAIWHFWKPALRLFERHFLGLVMFRRCLRSIPAQIACFPAWLLSTELAIHDHGHVYPSKDCTTSFIAQNLQNCKPLGISGNLTVLVPHHTISTTLLIRLLLRREDNSWIPRGWSLQEEHVLRGTRRESARVRIWVFYPVWNWVVVLGTSWLATEGFKWLYEPWSSSLVSCCFPHTEMKQ